MSDRAWYLRGAETGNPKVPGGYRWWLACNECGFHLEPGVAAAPRCPNCSAWLHIHSNAAPYTILWPLDVVAKDEPVVNPYVSGGPVKRGGPMSIDVENHPWRR